MTDSHAGKMTLQLPPYMGLDLDLETRKANLRVLNRGERKQREMWGKLSRRRCACAFC